MNGAIQAKTVTYDFERLMDGATLVSCSAFGEAVVAHVINRWLLKPAHAGFFTAGRSENRRIQAIKNLMKGREDAEKSLEGALYWPL